MNETQNEFVRSMVVEHGWADDEVETEDGRYYHMESLLGEIANDDSLSEVEVSLSESEVDEINGSAGFILKEKDSRYEVTWFYSPEELADEWDKIRDQAGV